MLFRSSYVYGLGVEVMTSSDNVLRLGLTEKPIAVDAALASLRDDRAPLALGGFAGEVLQPPGLPFRLVLADQPVEAVSGSHRVVLSLHGQTTVSAGDADDVIDEGEAAILCPGDPDAQIRPSGSAVVVAGDVGQLPG